MALNPVGLFPQNTPLVGPGGVLSIFWNTWFTGILNRNRVSYQTLSPAQVSANTTAEEAFTVPGARVGEQVSVSPPGHEAGVSATVCRVSAANTVSVTFVNPTGSGVTPTSGEYIFRFGRP